jgi:uncharacterized surface protein with fasciclin (FAS1) repeats
MHCLHASRTGKVAIMKTRPLLLVVVGLLALGHASPAVAQPKDIVDTAVAAGSFKTLARLLTEAELIGVMKGPGPYTVFAPTDDAFAKVPKEVLDGLAKDKKKLQDVLTYHVLTSKWTTDDIKLVKQTGTAQGKSVSFGAAEGTLTVNGAKVVKPNIDCTNGIVHAIDAVLMPPQ